MAGRKREMTVPSGDDSSQQLPYDPDEWERRLDEARERRARVLQQRMQAARQPEAAGGGAPGPGGREDPAPASVSRLSIATERALGGPPSTRRPARTWAMARRVRPLSAFAFGLGLGMPLAASLALLAYAPTDREHAEPSAGSGGVKAAPASPGEKVGAPLVHDAMGLPQTFPTGTIASEETTPFASVISSETTEESEVWAPHVPLAPVTATGAAPPQPLAAAEATPSVDLADRARVVVHVPQRPEPGAERLPSRLKDAGLTEWTETPIDLTISASHIRYYHAGDASAAQGLADALGIPLRDFTAYTPEPAPGLIEVWVAGRGTARAANPGQHSPNSVADEIAAVISHLVRTFPANEERRSGD